MQHKQGPEVLFWIFLVLLRISSTNTIHALDLHKVLLRPSKWILVKTRWFYIYCISNYIKRFQVCGLKNSKGYIKMTKLQPINNFQVEWHLQHKNEDALAVYLYH